MKLLYVCFLLAAFVAVIQCTCFSDCLAERASKDDPYSLEVATYCLRDCASKAMNGEVQQGRTGDGPTRFSQYMAKIMEQVPVPNKK